MAFYRKRFTRYRSRSRYSRYGRSRYSRRGYGRSRRSIGVRPMRRFVPRGYRL